MNYSESFNRQIKKRGIMMDLKEMEQIRILCYGDSNTWGYISGSNHQRYGNDERWTRVLGKLLGDKFEVIEEGLNSRTLISNDTRPGKEGKN